ncbi:DUF1415 domain-containing protein [Methylovulum miyakonense]|uniref:DUF1415 domain-containing protein n=1 Tax=Methylovulum miyakonense TaxID=645578 RepID=UPI000367B799|nr:DUF1415 domain-containing protein [Methylovulum miyakonense]
MNHSPAISATRAWLQTIIIGYSLCPFAKRELERNSIRYYEEAETGIEKCLLNLIAECARLDNDGSITTTLLIYRHGFTAFDGYLDFLDLAESLLLAQGYEGVYQIASFHPDYCFAGAEPDDPANYTNRSPYPMLHLLRESSIDFAVSNHPDVEGIPQRNIGLTRQLGLEKMQALLAACHQHE